MKKLDEDEKSLLQEKICNGSTTWRNIQAIRNEKRFKSLDLVKNIFTDFFELHGDRYYGDDKSIVGGITYLNDIPVTLICQYKGKGLPDSQDRQFGMPLPEGYRKALRLMEQAEKFNRPIICFIDTPGAYPGVNAEARGQAEAIARNLKEMFSLTVPIISLVVSEGGSGGALALGVANKVYMLEKAIYSVVSPEGCASILWKDSQKAELASEYLKLTADEIYNAGIVDGIISEKGSFRELCGRIADTFHRDILQMRCRSREQLKNDRKNKFINIGMLNGKQDTADMV